jgi:hypothetical protein
MLILLYNSHCDSYAVPVSNEDLIELSKKNQNINSN